MSKGKKKEGNKKENWASHKKSLGKRLNSLLLQFSLVMSVTGVLNLKVVWKYTLEKHIRSVSVQDISIILSPSLEAKKLSNENVSANFVMDKKEEPIISKVNCKKCGELWWPALDYYNSASYEEEVRWNTLCSKCWTKATTCWLQIPIQEKWLKICLLGKESRLTFWKLLFLSFWTFNKLGG